MIPKAHISLKDAMLMLRLGKPCDLMVWKFDKARNKGGQRVFYKNATLVQATSNKNHADKVNSDMQLGAGKNPHHNAHHTFNIQLANGEVHKVHTFCLSTFNSKRIAI